MTPPSAGEITQLAAMVAIVGQFTTPTPAAAMPAPRTPPTIAWVVDTGAPAHVAILIHAAAARRAAIIAQTKVSVLAIRLGSMMPLEIVLTTSPPAIRAPAVSKMTAMRRGAGDRQRFRADGRPDVIGDIVGADVERHIAADHAGGDDQPRTFESASLKGNEAQDDEEKHQSEAEVETAAASHIRRFFDTGDRLEIAVKRLRHY